MNPLRYHQHSNRRPLSYHKPIRTGSPFFSLLNVKQSQDGFRVACLSFFGSYKGYGWPAQDRTGNNSVAVTSVTEREGLRARSVGDIGTSLGAACRSGAEAESNASQRDLHHHGTPLLVLRRAVLQHLNLSNMNIRNLCQG